MPLQINIDDFTGTQTRQAKLAENAPVSKLIPQLVTALGYPVTDPAGRPVTYHINFKGRQLADDETLASAGVGNGDSIMISPEMTIDHSNWAAEVLRNRPASFWKELKALQNTWLSADRCGQSVGELSHCL